MLKNDNTIWKLPVFIKSKNFEICRLITSKNYEISFEELNLDYNEIEKGENFVVFNSDLKGFYRVKYNNEILLNSILTNFKKNSGEDNDKIKSVNDFDIFGLLSYEKYCDNFTNIKKIMNKIKPIEKSTLLLRYMKQTFQDFKQQYYYLAGFEEYITNEETQLKIVNQINEYEEFFISLVDKDNNKLKSLVNKFYINEENKDMYKNQFNDEFDSFYLYFRLIIDNNEEIAKAVLIPDVVKNFVFLNKNYKTTLIEVMMKYLYLITDKVEKAKLLLSIMMDYTMNFYNSSYYINQDYKNAICNFNSLNTETLNILNRELIFNKKNIFSVSVKTYIQGKKNVRLIFDSSIEKIKSSYEDYKKKYPDKNIITYFESQENYSYIFMKQFWFKQPKDQSMPLSEDILYNYLKDKFNITKDEEFSELLSAAQDFVK